MFYSVFKGKNTEILLVSTNGFFLKTYDKTESAKHMSHITLLLFVEE